MQSLIPREPGPPARPPIYVPAESRLPRLDLEWQPRGREFGSSLRDFLAGPRPEKAEAVPSETGLRVDFVEPKLPIGGFIASSLWHVAAIWILILPIWGFLPGAQPVLKPVQIELTWYAPAENLPPIKLNAPAVKPTPAASKRREKDVAPPADSIRDARRTIVSLPVRITHPRQTLIQPDAPPEPPKVLTPLPNIVQWTASAVPKLRLKLSPAASAPRIERRNVRNLAAPEIARADRDTGPVNIASATISKPQLPMPVSAVPAVAIERRAARGDAASVPAPEVSATEEGQTSLSRLIALSATPAPPAPEVRVPQGNLAARISVSPDAGKPGASGAATGAAGTGAAGEMTGSLPASIRVGNANAAGGNPAGAGIRPRALILKPMAPYEPSSSARREPLNIAALNPDLPPEKILSGKEVYTLHVTLPNLTSATGSWILNFAQLDEEFGPRIKPSAQLSGPVPYEKVDPKYPPEAIHAHVKGEVVLYAIIRKDGSVDSIQVVRGLDPELDRNAIAALAQWKFRPGMRGGVPVDLETVVHIPFNYKSPEE